MEMRFEDLKNVSYMRSVLFLVRRSSNFRCTDYLGII